MTPIGPPAISRMLIRTLLGMIVAPILFSCVRATTLEEARALARSGDTAGAESAARELLQTAEAAHGPESKEAADALDVLVRSLWLQRKTKDPEGRALAERAVAIREKSSKPSSPELGLSLYNLATFVRVSGDFAAALPLYERALAVQESALGPSHQQVADTLNGLAILYHRTGRYEDSKRTYERSLAVQIELFGPDHDRTALVYGNLSNVLRDMDDLEGARRLQERAILIGERTHGPESPELASNILGLGHILFREGDYEGAKSRYERVLANYEKAYGPDDVRCSTPAEELSIVHLYLGDYRAARSFGERAVRLDETNRGPDHPELAASLHALGSLYEVTGDLEGAQTLFRRAVAIWEKSPGPDSPRTAEAWLSLGRMERKLKNLPEARKLLKLALATQEKALGPEATKVAFTLDDLALLAQDEADAPEAARCAERSLSIRKKALGDDHPLTAQSRIILAKIRASQGDLDQALELASNATRTLERKLGPGHPVFAEDLSVEAGLLAQRGDTESAFSAALRAEAIGRDHLRETASVLTEEDALHYEQIRASGLSLALSLLSDSSSPERRVEVLDAVIRSRALVLDEVAARHRRVLDSDDSQVALLADELAKSRRRLAHTALRHAEELRAEEHAAQLAEAWKECKGAEQALAERSVLFREKRAWDRSGFDEVAAALPPRSALVSFVAYDHVDSGFRYVAFVVGSGSREAAVVALGGGAEIDSAVVEWNRAVRSGILAEGKEAEIQAHRLSIERGGRLRELVWSPLEEKIGDARRLFVVPDAALHLVNFAALPFGLDEFLIDRVETFHSASAERDLQQRNAEHPLARDEAGKSGGLLVVGGPDYDAKKLWAGLPETLASFAPSGAASHPPLRGPLPDCDEFARMRFTPLPGSAKEAKEVASYWKNARGPGAPRESGDEHAVRLDGRKATEARVKEEAPGNKVLHLATHGFLLDPSCASRGEGLRGGSMSSASWMSSKPLLASGLALAGANHRDAAGPDEEDGILTAEEIASLDLSHAQWAVLSACESGVGRVAASEGVFGLRRAFRVAGARTVFLTLWPVDDEAAREWIRELYSARFERGRATDEAASDASRAVLRRLRERSEVPHAFLWANFVASGDWR